MDLVPLGGIVSEVSIMAAVDLGDERKFSTAFIGESVLFLCRSALAAYLRMFVSVSRDGFHATIGISSIEGLSLFLSFQHVGSFRPAASRMVSL